MIAGYPYEELALAEGLADRPATLLAPVLKLVEGVEGELPESDVLRICTAAGGNGLAAVVCQHLAQLIAKEFRPGTSPATAKQIKRKQHDTGLHVESLSAWCVMRGACTDASRITLHAPRITVTTMPQ